MKQITSPQNPQVKEWLSLAEKSRERRKQSLFLIEGKREISLALSGNYTLKKVIFCPELIAEKELHFFLKTKNADFFEVSEQVYKKISYRTDTEGIIAIAESKNHSLENLIFKNEKPLILVAEAPEKPGNIGAILRTADAANLDAVIIANPKTDMYNPNIIRSSVGCVFTTQIAMGNTEEIVSFLKKQGFNIFCAALSASIPYDTADFTHKTAIVVGTEDLGLSNFWLENATQNIIIPMEGKIDSMNVSVAAAIITFEAKRQRKQT